MDRIHDILNSVNETLAGAAQKTYRGQKRSELKDSDFLFPETRSFPIVSPQDIPDAISNFGRMKGKMSYDTFLKKLYNMAKRKGPEFVAALPEATKEKLGVKTGKACEIPDMMDDYDYEDEGEDYNEEENDPIEMEIEKLEKEIELEMLKQKLIQIKKSKGQDFTQIETMEKEPVEQEMMEYKNDFYEMSLGSIKAIATHAQAILNALENPSVRENLTEPFLQGRIAITEDYMRTIHDYVMFSESEAENMSSDSADKKKKKMPPFAPPIPTQQESPPPSGPTAPAVPAKSVDKLGLWDNIRKKRQRMGKNYRPAKPGDKDRPDSDQWKKLSK